MKRVREVILCLILVAIFSAQTVSANPIIDSGSYQRMDDEELRIQQKIDDAKFQKHVNTRAVEAMSRVWDIENGELQEGATEELLEDAISKMSSVENENVKTELQKMADAVQAEFDKPTYYYFGQCRLTFYCGGSCCCGQWAGGNTASGEPPIVGRTVANGSLPFGTKVLIEGHEYVVTDRGVGANQFDIYVSSHSEALARGLYYADVYIVDD